MYTYIIHYTSHDILYATITYASSCVYINLIHLIHIINYIYCMVLYNFILYYLIM